jgi:hypothetical protein
MNSRVAAGGRTHPCQCIRHAPSERQAVVHDFSFPRPPGSLACWADDDDMSHETVVGHGQRVPD